MPLHPDKLTGLKVRFQKREATNRRPIAPISRPGPRKPGYRTIQPVRPGGIKRNPSLDDRRRRVAQQQRRQEAQGQQPGRMQQYQDAQRTQRPQASMQRQAKAKLLEKEPREPGVPTLLQKLAYRMNQGRLNRHFMDLQERRKESGFRKV